MKEYIDNSSKSIQSSFYEKSLGNTKIFIKDELPKNVNIDNCIEKVRALIPESFFNLIDYIIVGQFEILNDRDLQAAYDSGTIYITNEQDNELDMIDDIVHEIAHAVEERYDQLVYEDETLKSEFLGKRRRLYHMLESETKQSLDFQSFMNPEYDINFDNFLYYDMGYPLLSVLSSELFYSPYGITSLREYFANGFEAYFYARQFNKLKSISPILYSKIEQIIEEEKV